MMLSSKPVEHSPSTLKVVLLSGLSDPSSCALSRVQQQFLDRLAVPLESKVYANFPYVTPDRAEQAPIPLLLASWRNLSQFLRVNRSPYREQVLSHWQALVDSCQGLLVITISCGLEILNVSLSTGIRPPEIEVLALGPVAWARPPVPHTLIRGNRDYVLNPFFRSSDLIVAGLGHLNYMDHPAVLQLADQRLQALKARLAEAQSASLEDQPSRKDPGCLPK